MNFKYIIAIDFEATQPGPNEIIEFPAVLMDLRTGRILCEFHEYVKPTENYISQFCTNLTGIDQNTVDEADELPIVLQSFDNWLRIVVRTYGLILPNCNFIRRSINSENCVFVTWGEYDFKRMLIPECIYKDIEVPLYFRQWADLRKTFNSRFHAGQISFKNALQLANVPLIGRWHCGIDDARNLANLARKLLSYGVIITNISKY